MTATYRPTTLARVVAVAIMCVGLGCAFWAVGWTVASAGGEIWSLTSAFRDGAPRLMATALSAALTAVGALAALLAPFLCVAAFVDPRALGPAKTAVKVLFGSVAIAFALGTAFAMGAP